MFFYLNVCLFNKRCIYPITKHSIMQHHPQNNDKCNFQRLGWIRLKDWQRQTAYQNVINSIIHDNSNWIWWNQNVWNQNIRDLWVSLSLNKWKYNCLCNCLTVTTCHRKFYFRNSFYSRRTLLILIITI